MEYCFGRCVRVEGTEWKEDGKFLMDKVVKDLCF